MTDRRKLAIDLDGADDAVINITGADVYPTATSTSAVTFPATITTATTYYAVVNDPADTIRVRINVNGLDLLDVTDTITTYGRTVYRPNWGRALRTMSEDTGHIVGSPANASTTAVHAAVTDTGAEVEVTTAITNPDVPRNITATAGGTAGDIKAIQVTIEGTDIAGAALTETLPAFTVNTAGTVVGSKAFATVTSITIPAHDGTGATTAIGTGSKLGLPRAYQLDPVLAAYLDGVRESTLPTVAVDPTELASNTVTLDSTLTGDEVALRLA